MCTLVVPIRRTAAGGFSQTQTHLSNTRPNTVASGGNSPWRAKARQRSLRRSRGEDPEEDDDDDVRANARARRSRLSRASLRASGSEGAVAVVE